MGIKKRFTEKTDSSEVTIYKMQRGPAYDSSLTLVIQKCQEIVAKIQENSVRLPSGGWVRTSEVSTEDKALLKDIRHIFQIAQHEGGRGNKNILTGSDIHDPTVGFGKDNRVFGLEEFPHVVYKESSQLAGTEELLYLRRKYKILKTYLGDAIPQTRFILGEVNHSTQITKGMKNVDIPQMSIITLQRKVPGQSLQKMPKDAKKIPALLSSLEREHKKYILLKMFVRRISEEGGFPHDTIDVKMDLGPLSDMDQFDTQDPISIKKNLTSPNIMYDKGQIFFIDLDFGKWNGEKESVFEILMRPEILHRWNEVMEGMGLIK